MKIIYMGTPQFAVAPLQALAAAGHDILAVVTRADKPAGRGRAVQAPAVKSAALGLGLPLFQPKRVRELDFIDRLRELGPEIIVVAAYGQILPREILALPPFGCVNIHASLLPKYRGAAPVNWALIRGEDETGITIMQMDEGMDTGGILLQERIAIDAADTTGTLLDRLSSLGSRMIVHALERIRKGTLPAAAQDDAEATMAPILRKEDGRIDWSLPAREIHNRVRGLSPWPGAHSFLDGRLVKVLESRVAPGQEQPGSISAGSSDLLSVGTGRDLLVILRLQPEGKKPMSAAEFLRGHRDVQGKKFDSVKREG